MAAKTRNHIGIAAYARAWLIVKWVLLCAGIVWVLRKTHKEAAAGRTTVRCYRGIAWLMRLRVEVQGTLAQARPLLLVSNHISYLDIVALGSVAPLSFTPKSEIAGWPLIGFICRLTQCVFIDRRVSRTQENSTQLEQALQAGRIVSLFPEGTTGNGKHALPFRSSYFAPVFERAKLGAPVLVQPLRITYTHVHGLPVSMTQLPNIAWYGDMALTPHLMSLLAFGPVRVCLRFSPPLNPADFPDRKALAAACEQAVFED